MRLLDNEIRIMRSDQDRIRHESTTQVRNLSHKPRILYPYTQVGHHKYLLVLVLLLLFSQHMLDPLLSLARFLTRKHAGSEQLQDGNKGGFAFFASPHGLRSPPSPESLVMLGLRRRSSRSCHGARRSEVGNTA